MKEIQFVVTPKGSVSILTQGYRGAECKSATEAFERAVGLKTTDNPTPEFYEEETNPQAQPEGI